MAEKILPVPQAVRPWSVAVAMSILFVVLLTLVSVVNFTHTGPAVKAEIMREYSLYAAVALARLAVAAFGVALAMAAVGSFTYTGIVGAARWRWRWWQAAICSCLSLFVLSCIQFCWQLVEMPGGLAASFPYRLSRLYPLWSVLTPGRVEAARWLVFVSGLVGVATGLWVYRRMATKRSWRITVPATGAAVAVWCVALLPAWIPSPRGVSAAIADRPNIVMIGSDTLRADHTGVGGYTRGTTPFIDSLAKRGTYFVNCFVPLARTAPSLTTFLTGTFPHTHGVRSNYISDDQTHLPVAALPAVLRTAGYRTVAVSDWAGADLGKFNFGFDRADVAPDQWNLRFLIRQGPKPIRLFLTLFTHNRVGEQLLPELYYLAGVPMADQVVAKTKAEIQRLAHGPQPFFLMVFTSNTHLPFSTRYPYYIKYAKRDYMGESKFCMAGLTDPTEILKRQRETKESFDVQQLIDLYDGGVSSFDDAVRAVWGKLEAEGLTENTIFVTYSDHGIDLFEKYTWGQGNTLLGDDPSTRIPLLIVDPTHPGGRRVFHTTRSVDLMPTLLSMVGLEVPPTVEGVSLVPYLKRPDTDLGLEAFAETGLWLAALPGVRHDHLSYPNLLDMLYVPDRRSGALALKPNYVDQVITAKDREVRTDRWKLVYTPVQRGALWSLFDVRNDPNGRHDLSHEKPAVFRRLKGDLSRWLETDPERQFVDDHLVRTGEVEHLQCDLYRAKDAVAGEGG